MAAPALHTLLRLRQAAREVSQARLARAVEELEAQTARHQAVLDATAAGRECLDPGDPFSLTTWHTFRMRQELAERRESQKLLQRTRDVDQKRAIHVAHVRDELALQKVIDHHDAESAAEERTREGRRMDEIASRLSGVGREGS